MHWKTCVAGDLVEAVAIK